MQIAELLQIAVREDASDLHITVGRPPMLRVYGELVAIPGLETMNSAATQELLLPMLDDARRKCLISTGQVDFSYGIRELGRFRVNIYKQRGALSAAMRTIPGNIPAMDSLGLPEVMQSFVEKNRGLILITGPTGSGKSTTLAALIDMINSTRNAHIITLEDPIEYLHVHKKSIIHQREIGTDTISFADALRAALREDPDVILVGEMRDFETIQIAITAAETGHLVFATLHTNDTVQTVDRIIDVFPPSQQAQIRTQLALVLQAVVCQQLLPKADGSGRVIATEVMISNSAIRSLIREGKSHQIRTSIQTGAKYGMHTLDNSLKELFQQRIVTYQEAFMRATDPDEFRKYKDESVQDAMM